MKKGLFGTRIVTVYEDPITKKKPEGEARLIRKLSQHKMPGNKELWQVRFLDDGHLAQRTVG